MALFHCIVAHTFFYDFIKLHRKHSLPSLSHAVFHCCVIFVVAVFFTRSQISPLACGEHLPSASLGRLLFDMEPLVTLGSGHFTFSIDLMV